MKIWNKKARLYSLLAGVCSEPASHKYERVTRTLNAAKERARKTSATIGSLFPATDGRSPPNQSSMTSPSRRGVLPSGGNVNQNFVIDVNDNEEINEIQMATVERNLKSRIARRDGVIR